MIYINYIHSIYIYLYMMNTQHGYKIMTKILTKADNIFQFPPKKVLFPFGRTLWKLLLLRHCWWRNITHGFCLCDKLLKYMNSRDRRRGKDGVGDISLANRASCIGVSILYTYQSVQVATLWENTQRFYHIRGATGVYEGTLTFWLMALLFLMSAISRM